jgi:hypothetical protein
MNISSALRNDQKNMANVLFFVAMLQLLLGALYGWFYWNSFECSYWQGWVFVFSAPIYLILGITVRWIKYYSLLIGFVLYLYLTFTVHPLPYARSFAWQDGLVLKLPILTFLLWGLLVGDDWKQPTKKWKALLTAILMIACGFGVHYAIHEIVELNDWINDVQDSLKGSASNLPKETKMTQIVDNFCEANSKCMRMSIVDGCILGASGLSLGSMLLMLIIRGKTKADRGN